MADKKASLLTYILFLIISVWIFTPLAGAENSDIGFLLTDKNGKPLIAENIDKPLIPASILKIVTSLAAISYLGENYRYQTYFYYNKQSHSLYIKGFGDPLFISEEIKKACTLVSDRLKKENIDFINNIVLDNSFFEKKITIPGRSNTLNPYDAYPGALCANFNTIFFKTDSNDHEIVSAEKQTPLLPEYRKKIIATNLKKGRITLSQKESLLYPGLLIKYFLEKNSVGVLGGITLGKITAKELPFLIYTSTFDLKMIVQNLLKYSNNFIANQVLLTLGARNANAPSNLHISTTAVNLFLSKNFKEMKIQYCEGSGISRQNRISSKDMIKILIKFIPWHSLMKQDKSGFYKTGTLSRIRTRAGYITGKNNSLYPYVIMINQKNRSYNDILLKMKKRVQSL